MCEAFTSSQRAPSARTSAIEPSMSVRRNVTVPTGSLAGSVAPCVIVD